MTPETASERYLEEVLRRAQDLSSTSRELERYIKDGPSEYHLTRKRAQLLSGFSFDRTARVLEVGSGCGAITRLLGERFDDVVSVEGSPHRARLAGLRTRDLPGVTVICAPFREIEFTQKFDAVFCIGGLEDSAPVDGGDDPYDAVLRCFAELLTPEGMLVLAVENRFGLKCLASAREAPVFGRTELDRKLREYFAETAFYYPYPDYKLPDCVVSDEFLSTTRAGELIAEMHARDNLGVGRSSFDESGVSLKLAKDRMLPFFATSFLVVAGKHAIRAASFDQLGYLVSSARREKFSTTTRILEDDAGQIWVRKRPSSGADAVEEGQIKLTRCDSPWVDAPSLHTLVYMRCKAGLGGLAEIFRPCESWLRFLEAASVQCGGERYVGGGFVDCTWDDVFADGDGFRLVDQEWTWADEIAMNVVVIRAIYYFLIRIEGVRGLPGELERRSGKTLIREIAGVIGVQLTDRDFASFVALEAAFQSIVFGLNETRYRMSLRWYLRDRASQRLFRTLRQLGHGFRSTFRARLGRFFDR